MRVEEARSREEEAGTRGLRVVLHEGNGCRPLAPGRRLEVLEALLAAGYAVTLAGGAGGLAPDDGSDLLVLGEFEGGTPGDREAESGARVRFRDIAGAAAAEVLALVARARESEGGPKPGAWKPWFPVIDYQRCTNCMQCLSFCLFDVYGVDAAQRIRVDNPEKCKTNCPACSRVCPEVAILFPKYGAAPINGAEVDAADVEREKMKIDVSALLGGDIYSLLRERHERAASRFSKERDESKALKERIRCLQKLQSEMDVPPEVLMALPSAEEIRAKAALARERARSILDGKNP
jgi:NAD-dependent dihydropyrimidine dehydrogenase PreA subunit